jgi:hypothetical protein
MKENEMHFIITHTCINCDHLVAHISVLLDTQKILCYTWQLMAH